MVQNRSKKYQINVKLMEKDVILACQAAARQAERPWTVFVETLLEEALMARGFWPFYHDSSPCGGSFRQPASLGTFQTRQPDASSPAE